MSSNNDGATTILSSNNSHLIKLFVNVQFSCLTRFTTLIYIYCYQL